MNKQEQLEYKKEINRLKLLNLETLFLIAQYALQNIVESLENYELSKWVVKSYLEVMLEETSLLNYLKNNLDKIDSYELDKVLDDLDEINEETIRYFYGFLDDVQESYDFFNKYSLFRKITDTDKYRKEVYSITLTLSNIQEFLGVNNKVWNEIISRTVITEDEEFWGVNLKINRDVVQDSKIFVPEIKNLKTAMVNVHEFKHAYDIYQTIGTTYIDCDYEQMAKDSEKEFEDKYIEEKVKQYF